MFDKLSLRVMLSGLIIFLVLVTVATSAYISYRLNVENLNNKYRASMESLAEVHVQSVQDFLSSLEKNVSYLAQQNALKGDASTIANDESDTTATEGPDEISMDMPMGMGFDLNMEESASPETGGEKNVQELIERYSDAIGASQIAIADPQGNITHQVGGSESSISAMLGGYDPDAASATKESYYLSEVYEENGKKRIAGGMAVFNSLGDVESLVFIEKDLTPLFENLNRNIDLGQSVETILARDKENMAAYLMQPKRDTTKIGISKDQSNTPIVKATQGNEGTSYAIDYKGDEVMAVRKHIPEVNWGLVLKVDRAEIKYQAFNVVKTFAIYGSFIVLFTILIALLFSQFFISPILSLKNTLRSLSQGILPDKVEKKYDDEIGQMAETTNEVVKALRKNADFAAKIGAGNFDAQFQSQSKSDILGNALLEMRSSLQENERRDKARNWIVTGIAEISEILRRHDSIDDLGDDVISYVTNKIGAIQGAFYIVENEGEKNAYIDLKAAYAYNKKKYLSSRFKMAQGLVGQVAAEQATVMRTEIPDDYVSITSGILGDQRPTCILITPLITNEKVFGVLEFAGLQKFSDREVRFVEELSEILARTVFNIKVNERTRNLLEESQKMSSELREQQEILRQNAEEMEATQEELKRANQRLEEQIEEVNRTQTRMQLLLENASEVIAIYEKNKTIRYISPSVEKILGYQQNDLIGNDDIEHVHADYKDLYGQMFQAVFDNPYESKTIQFEYIKNDGSTIWLESTATNLLADKSIQGIIVNSRDITERRRAEQEERMRSKMQALSENSPDLITRLDQEGNFFYINPVIENYTGYKPSDFLNKNLGEVKLSDKIKEEWVDLLKRVEEESQNVALEMDFPSELGDRVMQINAIPEFDENEMMESVLLVSHDITERKQIELEIQSKNRKITESINYAQRIQGAILPDNNVIRKFLPESFILYKARDVVSGDFPWFIRVDNIIYFAAVDCTGHGVPGALISLIGYFLLNEIVKGRKITDPGLILDQLDESVTATLRQEQDDSKTKDGMDIALCKIDLDNNELTYAGAHRPLYFVKDGELQEIKGDKFPIGGGIYRNQTNFTDTKVKVGKGDSAFFCSDGYPDQFGGPDNRKFGPKRIRELISNNSGKSADELYDLFDNAWTEWKGDTKQIDDVLLIGVKF
jgi:PAS domain S-box-containing protein